MKAKLVKESLNEWYYEFTGTMKKDLEVGGKSYITPFSDTEENIIPAGTDVRLVYQDGSQGVLWQFYPIDGGDKIGSKWEFDLGDIDDWVENRKSLNEEFDSPKLNFNSPSFSFREQERISKLLNYTRKPMNLDEVGDVTIDMETDDGRFISNYLDSLHFDDQYIVPYELYNETIPSYLRDAPFICVGEDGETYVVDTSGYDYPRYLVKIVE